jgi:hypothetical protein
MEPASTKIQYWVADAISSPSERLEVPANQRVPFGWAAQPVASSASGEEIVLNWARRKVNEPIISVYFRLTLAIDVREQKLVEVRLAESGRLLGRFDIRYGYELQMFELAIAVEELAAVQRSGISLHMVQGNAPLWFFAEGAVPAGSKGAPAELLPHLMIVRKEVVPEQRVAALLSMICTDASLQPFSWMEGCVLDGLLDLAGAAVRSKKDRERFRHAAAAHLRRFINPDGRLVYENPRSEPADGRIYGIEGTLPWAAIAELWPEHALIRVAADFFNRIMKEDGSIIDGTMISAEGSYTVAYPLAVMAVKADRADWATAALRQLEVRRDRLTTERQLYLRWHRDGSRTFRSWARAYAWYMLGLVKTLAVLMDNRSSALDKVVQSQLFRSMIREWERIAAIAIQLQKQDGLWRCFVGEPDTSVDTSGSAGIAAALAIGFRLGLSGPAARESAQRAYDALQSYLTPDGFLGGVAQSNRGGEGLQRSDYRVLSQMGVGLLAQLIAALGRGRSCR